VTHQATHEMAVKYRAIAMEDLQVKNMTRRAKKKNVRAKSGLNKSFLNANPGEVRRQLEYKGELYGSDIITVDPRNTSKICSQCGNKKLDLGSSKVYSCSCCGAVMDRDHNAAVNIRERGLGNL